jgi:uncharacterized protein YrzB (UPF0473 family)
MEKLAENVLVFEKDGKEIECQILFTCNLDGFGDNNYVVFQIGDTDDISAARYIEENDGIGQLLDIETDEEWDLLDDAIESFYNDLESAEDDK